MIFACLTFPDERDSVIKEDPVTCVCLALTCKRLARIAVYLGVTNPLAAFHLSAPKLRSLERYGNFLINDFEYKEIKKFMMLLDIGWNRRKLDAEVVEELNEEMDEEPSEEVEVCQVSRKFARCMRPADQKSLMDSLDGLENIDSGRPVCEPCLRGRAEVFRIASAKAAKKLMWDGQDFGMSERLGIVYQSSIWNEALKTVSDSENSHGNPFYVW
ncbi:MAG: hypothetical protein Q9160_006950 [Pyrenula sp. 1 TL-2023]